ncbi:hypothetical protein N340_09820, partial [Tauraco erythrolophus]
EKEEQSVILISDDEAESTLGNSVLLVDPLEKPALEEKKSEEVVDEECELMVTFCKQAKVMPHARYDCTIHPFERTECDTCSPLGKNADICNECYCYICDKLASECQNWTTPSLCHCNAHNKSKFWKDQRDFALAGVLVMFNLELTDIDADLRHGGSLLIKFIQELSVEYNKYLIGERMPPTQHECFCLPKLPPGQCNICRSRNMEVVYKYSGVFALVTRFLNQAERESPKAAAVMFLGAAKEIALHKDPALYFDFSFFFFSKHRITTQLQRMLVLCDFPKSLYEKFVNFFQSISLPCHCFGFSNSLNVVPWDHVLLTTVLKGQNITGQRTQKGRKVFLWETLPVIDARVEKLIDKNNYKEVVRYLRAVKCNDTKGLRDLRDKIPFYLCKTGDFLDAAHSLLFPVNSLACCTACRITPFQFEVYLKMFRTGSVPAGKDMLDPGPWITVGKCDFLPTRAPLKDGVLIKQALKLLYTNVSLYRNPKCWSSLIMILGSSNLLEKSGHLHPLSLKEPPLDFQQGVVAASGGLLEELKAKINVSLPPAIFSPHLHHEACLILAVQAVQQMLFCDLPYLTSFLEIALAFGNNFWALRLLLDHLSYEEQVLHGTVNLILRDLNRQ